MVLKETLVLTFFNISGQTTISYKLSMQTLGFEFILILFQDIINIKYKFTDEYKIFRFNKSNLLFPSRRV